MNGMRRRLFSLSGGRGQWLDPYLRKTRLSPDKRRAWFDDQYRHPHESTHTIGEVLGWFAAANLDFVRGVPSTTGGADFTGGLLTPTAPGTAVDHFRAQLRHIASGNREGGFFLMIGRKKGAPLPASAGQGRPDRRGAAVESHAV